MLVFFEEHPTVGNSYQFTNILTGETVTRTVQQRLRSRRKGDVFFEIVMVDNSGEIVTAEYEINS